MNIPKPYVAQSYSREEPSLLMLFTLKRLEVMWAQDKDPTKLPDMPDGKPFENPTETPGKPKPEMPAPPREPGPKPEVKPEIAPDPGVVEIPNLPDMPEVGVPQRDLPGGALH